MRYLAVAKESNFQWLYLRLLGSQIYKDSMPQNTIGNDSIELTLVEPCWGSDYLEESLVRYGPKLFARSILQQWLV